MLAAKLSFRPRVSSLETFWRSCSVHNLFDYRDIDECVLRSAFGLSQPG